MKSFLILLLASLAALSADVPSWRKDGNGLYPDAKAPTDWKETVWETALPARSNGSPILVGGRLFFTAEPTTLICADAETGKLLWQKENEYTDLMGEAEAGKFAAEAEKFAAVSEKLEPLERELYRAQRKLKRGGEDPELQSRVKELKAEIRKLNGGLGAAEVMKKPPAHNVNGYSSYTPVSDGKKVWVSFGTGVVVCYSVDGERLWNKRLDPPDHNWGGACSPTLVDGKLIVRFKDYVALDPSTGKELWRTPSEGVTFNAPASFERDGMFYLITARGELIRASDGKKLPSSGFQVDAKPWCFLNTPSVIGSRVYFAHGCEGQQGDAYCLEIPASARHVESQGLKQVWHTPVNQNRYYSSPVVHDGVVHLISRDYMMQALNAADGEVLYSEKVRGFTGTAYPSLTLVGDALFIGSEDGNAAFIEPGGSYKEISRTEVEPYRSTPIFDGDRGYLRTHDHLKALRAK